MKRPTGTAASAPTTSAGATSAISAATNGSASSKSTDSSMRSRSSTASIHAPRSSRPETGCSCWTTTHNARRTSTRTRRSRRNSTCARAARSARFASAPHRRPTSTSPAASRRRSTRGSCRGGRASGSATTTRSRCPTGPAPTTWTWALSGRIPRRCSAPAYNGSWFNNEADTLTWDNPLVLTDSTSASGHGRMALWPSNSLQTLSAAGYAKFARRTQLTGSLAFGWANNDEPLQPFTINSALPQFALPRATADASATTVATNISLVSRPANVWRFSTRFRRYDYNNDMPETPIPRVHQLRHVGQGQHDGRAGAVRARPQYVRCRCHVDPLPSGGPHRRVHEQPQRLRPSHLRVDEREHTAAQGRLDRFRVGELPRALRVRQTQRFRPG